MKKKKINILRYAIQDLITLGKRKNNAYIFGKLDVTECISKLEQKKIPLYPYLLYCYSKTVADNKNPINTYWEKQKNVIEFNEVDVAITVVRRIEGEIIPLFYIIRNAHTKSIEDFDNEISIAKRKPVSELLDKNAMWFYKLPLWVRNKYWRYVSRRPELIKKYFGTTAITTLHNMGDSPLQGITDSIHTFTFAIGSILNEDGKVWLRYSAMLDHNILDGLPAVKFVEEFKTKLLTSI